MLYIGWILAAFLMGVALTLGAVLWRRKRLSLHERFDGLGLTLGKDYARIASAVGAAPQVTQRRPDGSTLRTWREGSYTITLLFDSQDYCLGVMEERE